MFSLSTNRLFSGVLGIVAAAGSMTAAVAAVQPSAPPRSLWVWDTAAIRAGGRPQQDFFRFLTAPHGVPANAIRAIYFDGLNVSQLADPAVTRDLRRFLKTAHTRHLRVDFLTGDPHWATAARQPEGLAYIKAILDFNRGGATAAERFDGFQYDVEPYSLPDWPSPALRQGLLDLLDRSRELIHASGHRLLLTAAIPRWFDQPQFGFLDQGVIDRTDEVLIMDYVESPDRLVDDASGELDYAARVGKKVWVGVETGEVKDAPQTSFFDLGDTRLEAVLAAARPRLAARPAFAGYAIHHWAAYVTLKP